MTTIEAGAALGPDRYLEVRYESLVEHPESECRRVCDFLGLSFAELGYPRAHPDPSPRVRADAARIQASFERELAAPEAPTHA